MNQEIDNIVEHISDKDLRYKQEAYFFILEALSYTQRKCQYPKHITGEELLQGIKDFSIELFGPMTLTVLRCWGIQRTEDFGNIVFNLVHNKVLSKTAEDNIESFRNGYDFDEVFNQGYRKLLAKKISRMR